MGKLFETGYIGRLEVKNRIVMPPMVTDYAHPDGTVSPAQIAYYARRARGGVGMIVVEATAIDSRHRLSEKQLNIDSDAYLPGLTALARTIKSNGARAAIQLHHPGRQLTLAQAKEPAVGPSPLPVPLPGYPTPRELSQEEIRELVERFASAALRAKEAGFDAVELHGAHSYLICQFLSPFSNQRQDEYGGSLDNRARFALEAIEAVKDRLGRDYPVILRLSGAEFVQGGLAVEDTRAIARLAQEAGANSISVSAGNRLSSHMSTQPVLVGKGCLVPLAQEIRHGVSIPVMVAGRINDPQQAEAILEAEKADFICIGRGLLSDPDLPIKAQEGRGGQVLHCIACMTCSQQRAKGWLVCLINPEVGHEGEAETPAPFPGRVLVLDSGAAGLEAARVARLRGHQVALWSREARPGSRWSWLIRAYLNQQLKALRELGVEVELGKEFSAATVAAAGADVIIAGPARKPVVPPLLGIHQDNVVMADAFLDQGRQVAQPVAILGGGNVGYEVAFALTARGARVTILEPGPQLGQGIEERTARVAEAQLRQRGAQIHLGVQVRSIQSNTLTFVSAAGTVETITAEGVVIALGYESDYRLVDELQERGLNVHRVSYSTAPAAVYELAQKGADIARKI